MRRKPRLTLDQHIDLGRTLAGLRDELVNRSVQLGTAYPKNGPDAGPANKLRTAVKAIDQARNALDSNLFAEHPAQASPAIYYPHPDSRASVVTPTKGAPDHA